MDDEEPIMLGGPTDENEFEVAPESEPTYLGDVNESSYEAAPYEAAPYEAAPYEAAPYEAAPYEADPYEGSFEAAPYEAPSDEPIVLMGPGGMEDVPMKEENVSNEPTPMQLWSTEWQETLKERKDNENARKAELLEASRVALEEFVQTRESKRESNMSRNREDEQAKLEAIEADLENDNSWQRVCKMVELSHDSTSQAEDVKRMRDVLILLKNEPTRAEALST
jgi:hypothetical protein